MKMTTIQVSVETKDRLAKLGVIDRLAKPGVMGDTYDGIIKRLLDKVGRKAVK